MKLERPTSELIKKYTKIFDVNERYQRYYLADQAIEKLCKKFKGNNDFNNVLLKVVAINDLYSTHVFATFIMAKHIHSLKNIDSALKKGDPKIVNKIAKITIKGKKKNFYSFATKYCGWHEPTKYALYDSYIHKILMDYKKQTIFFHFKNEDLRNYIKFLEILENFKGHFYLTKFDFKEIDKFLWTCARERYPKKVFKK